MIKKRKPKKTSEKRSSAWAPYNFIPLNDVVVGAEFQQWEQAPAFDRYCCYDWEKEQEYLTGEIFYELETITPLYIRGVAPEKSEGKNDNPDFFAPGGKVKIPGSSVRGMVRNLLEIVSWGKFENFDDKLLYYRGLADQSNLREEYRRNMSFDRKAGPRYKFKAGYLSKEGNTYYIIPAKVENGRQFSQVKKRNKNEEFVIEKRKDGKYLVVSGNVGGKKKKDWLLNAPDFKAKKIMIIEEDIKSYRNDESRYYDKEVYDKSNEKRNKLLKKDGDLLRLLEVSEDGLVPCFYVMWTDAQKRQRVSFGHTGYFRLAYKYSIGEHVPNYLQNEIIDLPEAIFGIENSFASRVLFEDAHIVGDQNNVFLDAVYPKILALPKPTTFQHYLTQPEGEKTESKSLNHWNSSPDKSPIRGYKYYWHRDTQNDKDPNYWVERGKINKNLQTKIQPVKSGVKFKGKIRFMNLTPVELGALLFVLKLPENHYHKLGMGKPLGLGSVKITPKLEISDRIKRYTTLFDNNANWENAQNEETIEQYINAFEQYILTKLEELGSRDAGAKTLWDTERLKNLKVMLDWENTKKKGWLEKTRYMKIERDNSVSEKNEYKKRPVLPEPIEVLNCYNKN